MVAINNLYIDEVFFDRNNGSTFPGTTFLSSPNTPANIWPDVDVNNGYKFSIQIVNGTGAKYQMTTTNYFRIKISYSYVISDGKNGSGTVDTIYNGPTSGEIPVYIGGAGDNAIPSSFFFGSADVNPGSGNSLSIATLLPNPYSTKAGDTDRIVVDFVVYLQQSYEADGVLEWSTLDVVGSPVFSYENTPECTLESGVTGKTFDNLVSGADGGLYRLSLSQQPSPGNDIPDLAGYESGDWSVYSGNFADVYCAGDPHICTLSHENYKFDYLGPFRMFDDIINGNKIIINGLSENGPGKWNKNEYVQKYYIKFNDKELLLDTGFRGSPIKVLKNSGIEYLEKELSFDKNAKRYSFSSRYSTLDLNKPITDDLPGLIRNQITILLNDEKTCDNILTLNFQNVNKYNLQPCRFVIANTNYITNNAKGCIVDRKYATVCELSSIDDCTELREPNAIDLLNIPELEISPVLLNKQWV